MRTFILSLPTKSHLLVILLSTILIAFAAAFFIHFCFDSTELLSRVSLITAIYAVLGTIYAVLIAFSVSGVWQNYCAAELGVSAEVAALTDLVHTVWALSTQEKRKLIRHLAVTYAKQVVTLEWPALAKGHNELIISPEVPTFGLVRQLTREIQTVQPVDARDNVIFAQALTLLTKWLDARRTRIMISKGNR